MGRRPPKLHEKTLVAGYGEAFGVNSFFQQRGMRTAQFLRTSGFSLNARARTWGGIRPDATLPSCSMGVAMDAGDEDWPSRC